MPQFTRRQVAQTGVAVPATASGTGHASGSLTIKVYRAGENGFFRAPVLLTGDRNAVLIDGGQTFADAEVIVNDIRSSGKRLTTIYVSQGDPDFYFNLLTFRTAFPDAEIIAQPDVVAHIEATVSKKLEIWGPKFGDRGPTTINQIVIPKPWSASTLTVDGDTIQIIRTPGFALSEYLWVPSNKAVFGGVLVYSGLHVWTADTHEPAQRAAWVRALDEMASRAPQLVVPGHTAVSAPNDVRAVAYTREYLLAFEEVVAASANSAAVVSAMKARYRSAGFEIALDIGAKVAKGEMKWG
jgi:glyoxylase-like metal-dependent hydrolase (beta-lactamase superfamily II)